MTSACEQVRLRLASPEAGRRLGQALWMMSGRPVSPTDLVWAQGVLGKDAEQLLWSALREARCFDSNEPDRLNVWALASFMCSLVAGTASQSSGDLVWTFPAEMFSLPGVAGDSYSSALKSLVESAAAALTIVSPYLEAKGVGCLEEAVVDGLYRGVNAVIVTHEADDLGSMNSAALKSLRAAASGLAGRLTVYTTSPKGVLMHMKAVVADGERAVVGSANLTGKGLGGNVELGVRLGAQDAQQIQRVVNRLIDAGVAEHVFST
jgi:phosphatidylserine/phosphatidylglycerophosphate/cardiolipin synthase-like enzyme